MLGWLLPRPWPPPRRDSIPTTPTSDATNRSLVRVLHVINGEHYSGAERVQDLLAKCLPAEGFLVGFACLKPDRFPESRTCREAPLHDLGMQSRLDLHAAWRLAKLIRRDGYDIVHAHTPRSAMIGRLAAAWTGRPFVYHVHSPTALDSTRRWQNVWNAWLERASLWRAARLITVSRSLGDRMRAAGFSRISVVPNGVPARAEIPDRDPPGASWKLGMVALFRPRKGTEVLLAALAVLRQAGHDVVLRAVGPFETEAYQRELKSHVERLGLSDAVQWVGFTRDVDSELAKMDLMILPSLFGEGLPMVILEAMAIGVPVVATAVEGTPEAIRDGIDGLIARPNDAEDLASTIARVVTGQVDWRQLRENSLARQRTQFSDQSMAAGVAAAYRALGAPQAAQ